MTNTEEKILDAALELFSEDGFKGATTKAIAEKAGVNEVTLFRYFGTKDRLFMAVVDREASARMEIINIRIEPSGDMAGDLANIGIYMAEKMTANSKFFRLLVLEAERFPEAWEHIGTVPLAAISAMGKYFDSAKKKGLVRKDADSEVMAVTFFSFMFRILVANAFLGDDLFFKGGREDGIRKFTEIFVNGIRSD